MSSTWANKDASFRLIYGEALRVLATGFRGICRPGAAATVTPLVRIHGVSGNPRTVRARGHAGDARGAGERVRLRSPGAARHDFAAPSIPSPSAHWRQGSQPSGRAGRRVVALNCAGQHLWSTPSATYAAMRPRGVPERWCNQPGHDGSRSKLVDEDLYMPAGEQRIQPPTACKCGVTQKQASPGSDRSRYFDSDRCRSKLAHAGPGRRCSRMPEAG